MLCSLIRFTSPDTLLYVVSVSFLQKFPSPFSHTPDHGPRVRAVDFPPFFLGARAFFNLRKIVNNQRNNGCVRSFYSGRLTAL